MKTWTCMSGSRKRGTLHMPVPLHKGRAALEHHMPEMPDITSTAQSSMQLGVLCAPWNMYLRPSWTSWCARQTSERPLMWLNSAVTCVGRRQPQRLNAGPTWGVSPCAGLNAMKAMQRPNNPVSQPARRHWMTETCISGRMTAHT